jgi:exonuclease SbcC
MRLIKLRLRNLNSLYGEWVIDFTHPAYASDRLFAVCGPTGAGKTTILDALCLALYGRTPRLGNSQRTGLWDVMSRGESECLAEVIFGLGGGVYLTT